MQFQFDDLSQFLAMGGYGFYVWMSFGISLVSIVGIFWQSKNEQKKLFKQVHRELIRAQQKTDMQ